MNDINKRNDIEKVEKIKEPKKEKTLEQKQENKKFFLNVLVLSVVALIMGLTIAVVFSVTKKTIDDNIEKNTQLAFTNILNKSLDKNDVLKIDRQKIFQKELSGYTFIKNDKYSSNTKKVIEKLEKNKEKLNLNTQSEITSLTLAFKDNMLFAYFYTVKGSNKYGDLLSVVAVDSTSNKILSLESVYNNNTLGIGDKGHEKYSSENENLDISSVYKDNKFTGFLKEGEKPLYAGASFTSRAVSDMERTVLKYHMSQLDTFKDLDIAPTVVDKSIEYIGNIEYTKSLGSNLEIDKVSVIREYVKADKYEYLEKYTLTHMSEFSSEYGKVSGTNELVVYTTRDSKIVYIELPDDKYHHTKPYKVNIDNLLSKLINVHVVDITTILSKKDEIFASPTSSQTLEKSIIPMLEVLTKLTTTRDNILTYENIVESKVDGVTIKEGDIKLKENTLGKIYRLTFSSKITPPHSKSHEGNISISIHTNNEKIITDAYIEDEGYSHTLGFKKGVDNIVSALVDSNIENLGYNIEFLTDNKLYAGSTLTYDAAIKPMLKALNKKINPLQNSQIVEDNSFVKQNDSSILSKYKTSDNKYVAYLLSTKMTTPISEDLEVKYLVYLDSQNTIKGLLIIDYKQTPHYRIYASKFIKTLLNTKLVDLDKHITDNEKIITGATSTINNVFIKTLKELREAIK